MQLVQNCTLLENKITHVIVCFSTFNSVLRVKIRNQQMASQLKADDLLCLRNIEYDQKAKMLKADIVDKKIQNII